MSHLIFSISKSKINYSDIIGTLFKLDYSFQNLWFRLKDGTIIKNDCRCLIEDINTLPTINKELLAPHVPIRYSSDISYDFSQEQNKIAFFISISLQI